MGNSSKSNRFVSVGGNATDNVVQTGDNNVASIRKIQMSPPESIDIQYEVQEIRKMLLEIHSIDHRKINDEIDKIEKELLKENNNKRKIGKTLENVLTYAKKLDEYSEVVEKLAPRIVNTVSWLGRNWEKLLTSVGM